MRGRFKSSQRREAIGERFEVAVPRPSGAATHRAHGVGSQGRVVLFVVLARGRLIPPDPPLSDGEVVLRMRRAADVPLIAEASSDAETQRRMDDELLTPDRGRDSVARAEEAHGRRSAVRDR